MSGTRGRFPDLGQWRNPWARWRKPRDPKTADVAVLPMRPDMMELENRILFSGAPIGELLQSDQPDTADLINDVNDDWADHHNESGMPLSDSIDVQDTWFDFTKVDEPLLLSANLLNQGTATIMVEAVNEVPVNNMPGAQSIYEDTILVFSLANGNQILVSDSDVGTDNLQVTLSVTNGALTLSGTVGLNFIDGDGTADATMTFEGTVANINDALDGLSFNPTANYNGGAQLTLTTVDSVLTDRELDYRFQDGTPSGNTVVNISSTGGITGVATDFDVTALSSALTGSTDTFGVIYSGVIDITTAGTYTFFVGSDDGSIVYIDGSAVVTNDGLHSFNEQSDTVVLSAGRHTLEVRFFENLGSQQLTAHYSGPDTSSVKTSLLDSSSVGRIVSVSDSVSISVNAVNDQPVRIAGAPAGINVNEDSANSIAVTLGMNGLAWDPGGGGDESAQNLTYKVTAIPSFMTLWLSDGTTQVTADTTLTLAELQGLKYKTVADASGSGNLSWTVQDNGGTSNGGVDTLTENLAITVMAVNDTPVITSDGGGDNASTSVAENTTAVTTVTSNDVDGGPVTYNIVAGGDGARFNIDASTGVLTFALPPNRESPTDSDADNVYVVTVQVSDGAGGTDTQVISVTVNDEDEFDVSTPSDVDAATNEVDENAAIGTTVGLTAVALDLDATNNTVTYSLTSNPDGLFQIDANTGVVTTAAAINRETYGAVRTITVQATGSDGSTATQDFNIAINDLNEFDVGIVADADGSPNTVAENAPIGTAAGITAFAEDLDATNNTITYTLDNAGGGMFAIDANTGVVTVNGALDYEGATSHNLTVRATSSDGSFSTQSFTINVSDVNEAPSVSLANVIATLAENTDTSSAIRIADIVVSDDMSGTNNLVVTGADAASFEIVGSELRLKAGVALDFATKSNFDVTVQIDDATVGSTPDDSVNHQLLITEYNETPTLSNNGSVVGEGGTDTITGSELRATDVDNTASELTFTVTSGPANGRLERSGMPGVPVTSFTQAEVDSGVIRYLHNGSETVLDQFTFDLSDGQGNVISNQTFNVQVTPVNDAPVATNDTYTIQEDTTLGGVNVTSNDSDVENGPLTVSLVSGPQNAASFVLNADGSFTYRPVDNYYGSDSFSYLVNDGNEDSSVATVWINIQPVIDLPTSRSDDYVLTFGSGLNTFLSVLANDLNVEGSALHAILLSQPQNGLLFFNTNGSFSYLPDSGFVGTDSFTYVPTDGTTSGTVTVVTINVIGALQPIQGTSGGYDDADTFNENSSNLASESDSVDGTEKTTDASGDLVMVRPRKVDAGPVSRSANRDAMIIAELEQMEFNASLADRKADLPSSWQALEVLEFMLAGNRERSDGDSDEKQITSRGVSFVFNAAELWRELDKLGSDVAKRSWLDFDVESSIAVSTFAATTGYVLWSLRSGFLIATLVSSLPTWSHFDPLPLLETGNSRRNAKPGDRIDNIFE